jgi:hypothetical protein
MEASAPAPPLLLELPHGVPDTSIHDPPALLQRGVPAPRPFHPRQGALLGGRRPAPVFSSRLQHLEAVRGARHARALREHRAQRRVRVHGGPRGARVPRDVDGEAARDERVVEYGALPVALPPVRAAGEKPSVAYLLGSASASDLRPPDDEARSMVTAICKQLQSQMVEMLGKLRSKSTMWPSSTSELTCSQNPRVLRHHQ